MNEPVRQPVYVFEGFRLDAHRRVLFGVAGQPIALTPRLFDTLLYLVERAGQLLTKERLLEDLWPNVVVEEHNLNKTISELRRVLGEKPGEHKFIVTKSGRGYRFVADVSLESRAADTGAREIEPPEPVDRIREGTATLSAEHSDQPRRNVAYSIIGTLSIVVALSVVVYYSPALSTLLRRGDSAPVLERARTSGPNIIPLTFDGGEKRRPRISPDGKMVAFAWYRPERNNADVYVKQIGRDTTPIQITDHPFFDGEVAWSADGTELAFLRDEAGNATAFGGRLSIYVAPALGGPATKIIDLESRPYYSAVLLGAATWSPNRRVLAYSEKASADTPARIVRLDLDTHDKRALSMPPAGADIVGDYEPAFSPHGDRIAFLRGTASFGNADIWIMDAEGGNEQRLTVAQWGRAHSLSWIADGKGLLFTAGSVTEQSYTVRLDDGVPRPLPGLGENDRFASAAANRLVFARSDIVMQLMWQAPGRLAEDHSAAPRDLAREGIKLVFSPNGEKIAWQGQRTGRPQIWIADRDGANARALTDQRVEAYSPRWSPDGRQIAFYSGDAGNADVYLVDVAGRRVRPLTADKSEDRYPTFAPDGRSIYFSSNRSGRFEIYRMPADGGEAVPVTASGATFAIASYDGHYLYYEYLPDNTGHTGDSPIWRVPVDAKGPVVEVLPGWQRIEEQWVVGRDGIYYLRAHDFRYRDLGNGTDIPILSDAGLYPAVSPDEKTVFFSREAPPHSELWLVENFR